MTPATNAITVPATAVDVVLTLAGALRKQRVDQQEHQLSSPEDRRSLHQPTRDCPSCGVHGEPRGGPYSGQHLPELVAVEVGGGGPDEHLVSRAVGGDKAQRLQPSRVLLPTGILDQVVDVHEAAVSLGAGNRGRIELASS